eukprot:g5302.t1
MHVEAFREKRVDGEALYAHCFLATQEAQAHAYLHEVLGVTVRLRRVKIIKSVQKIMRKRKKPTSPVTAMRARQARGRSSIGVPMATAVQADVDAPAWNPYSAPIAFAKQNFAHEHEKTFPWTWDMLMEARAQPTAEWLHNVARSTSTADILPPNLVTMFVSQGYPTVGHLLLDYQKEEFRNLFWTSVNMRLRNEIMDRLKDMSEAIERISRSKAISSKKTARVKKGGGGEEDDDDNEEEDKGKGRKATVDASVMNATAKTIRRAQKKKGGLVKPFNISIDPHAKPRSVSALLPFRKGEYDNEEEEEEEEEEEGEEVQGQGKQREETRESYDWEADGTFRGGGFEIRESGVVKGSKEKKNLATTMSIKDELIILNKLGAGAGGVVHKALHVPTLTFVAVKQIRVFEASTRRQVLRELQALYESESLAQDRDAKRVRRRWSKGAHLVPQGKGQCPHIVSFFEAFTDRQTLTISIVLEYMDAGSLQDLIDSGVAMDERVVANIGYRVLCGLEFLHKKHIIHRDIKPSNLLINRHGDVKIGDFGISKQLEGTEAMSTTYLGTLMYMAPERIQTSSYGRGADIWALGLSLLACALGKFPLDTQKGGYWALTTAIAEKPLPTLTQFSPEFQDFIQKCLARDPKRRPTAAELLSHKVFQKHECESSLHDGNRPKDTGEEDVFTSSFNSSTSNALLSSVSSSFDFSAARGTGADRTEPTDPTSEGSELDIIATKVAADSDGYIDPAMLKHLAKQLNLPAYVVIGHFDRKMRMVHENKRAEKQLVKIGALVRGIVLRQVEGGTKEARALLATVSDAVLGSTFGIAFCFEEEMEEEEEEEEAAAAAGQHASLLPLEDIPIDDDFRISYFLRQINESNINLKTFLLKDKGVVASIFEAYRKGITGSVDTTGYAVTATSSLCNWSSKFLAVVCYQEHIDCTVALRHGALSLFAEVEKTLLLTTSMSESCSRLLRMTRGRAYDAAVACAQRCGRSTEASILRDVAFYGEQHAGGDVAPSAAPPEWAKIIIEVLLSSETLSFLSPPHFSLLAEMVRVAMAEVDAIFSFCVPRLSIAGAEMLKEGVQAVRTSMPEEMPKHCLEQCFQRWENILDLLRTRGKGDSCNTLRDEAQWVGKL